MSDLFWCFTAKLVNIATTVHVLTLWCRKMLFWIKCDVARKVTSQILLKTKCFLNFPTYQCHVVWGPEFRVVEQLNWCGNAIKGLPQLCEGRHYKHQQNWVSIIWGGLLAGSGDTKWKECVCGTCLCRTEGGDNNCVNVRSQVIIITMFYNKLL